MSRRAHRVARFASALAIVALSGCVAAVTPGGSGPENGSATDTRAATSGADIVPAGFGTLRQDDITVGLRAGDVQVRVTPLAPWILPLTAPETHRRLDATAGRIAPSRREGLMPVLVSFFTDAAGGVPFEPAELVLVNRGRRFRAEVVEGLTTGWEQARLEQGRPAQALYLFDGGIDLEMDLAIEFGSARSNEWNAIVPRLQAERARVRGRAGGSILF